MPDTFLDLYEFILDSRSTFSVQVRSHSFIYRIPRDNIEELCFNDLEFKQNYRLLQYKLLVQQKLELIFYSCLLCGKIHHWYECDSIFPRFKPEIS